MGSACSSCGGDSMDTIMREWDAQLIVQHLASDPELMTDKYGSENSTVLHLAAKHDRFSICRWLLNKGFSLTTFDDQGRSPLHVAVEDDALFALREILQHQFRNTTVRNLSQLMSQRTANGRTMLALCSYRPPRGAASTNNGDDAEPGSGSTGSARQKYRADSTPSENTMSGRQHSNVSPSVSPSRSPAAGYFREEESIDMGESDDQSGVFSGDTAREEDLDVDFDDQDLPRKNEDTPDDVMLDSSRGSGQSAVDPVQATGAPSLQYLLHVDRPPSQAPRHHSPGIIHHFVKAVKRYIRSVLSSNGARSQPVIAICASGRGLEDVIPHAFLGPAMFIDRRHRFAELTQLITARGLDHGWTSLLPDVNLSYRALFGAVEAPDGGEITPRRRRRRQQLAVQDVVLTPLLVAVYCGSLNAVKQLIVVGGRSQVFVADSSGNNVLHYAIDYLARTGNDRVLRFCLTYMSETTELRHKTNNNGLRPGQFNASEALQLQLLTPSAEPLETIPSAMSFGRRGQSAANGFATVPSMSNAQNMDASMSPGQAPIQRTGTSKPMEDSMKSLASEPSTTDADSDHPLAKKISEVSKTIADVDSGSGTSSDDDDADLRASQKRRSTASAPAGDEAVEGDVESAASVRRPNKQRAPPPAANDGDSAAEATPIPGAVSDPSDMPPPASAGDETPPPTSLRDAPTRSPALGHHDPDSNVLPCLRRHQLRSQLKL